MILFPQLLPFIFFIPLPSMSSRLVCTCTAPLSSWTTSPMTWLLCRPGKGPNSTLETARADTQPGVSWVMGGSPPVIIHFGRWDFPWQTNQRAIGDPPWPWFFFFTISWSPRIWLPSWMEPNGSLITAARSPRNYIVDWRKIKSHIQSFLMVLKTSGTFRIEIHLKNSTKV